jgi:hypothetical protein
LLNNASPGGPVQQLDDHENRAIPLKAVADRPTYSRHDRPSFHEAFIRPPTIKNLGAFAKV